MCSLRTVVQSAPSTTSALERLSLGQHSASSAQLQSLLAPCLRAAFLSSACTLSPCQSKHLEGIADRRQGWSRIPLLCHFDFACWKIFLAAVQTFSFSLHAWGESLPWEVLRVSSSECPWGQGSSWSYKRARSWVRKRCWGQTFIRFSQIALCQSRRDICSPSSIFPNLLYAPDCRINNGCGSRCRAE